MGQHVKFYTYKRQVPLKPGEKLGYRRGHGYYVIPAPAPHPPLPLRDTSRALCVVFCAEDPAIAAYAPAKYARALSADHAYRYPNDARPDLDLHTIISQLRQGGARVPGWCDCRPTPDGTPASEGIAFAQEYGLDYFIGQAESSDQFTDAYDHGARVMVGNRASLTTDQIAHLHTDVLFIQEDYWNEGWARDPSPDITAYCAGVYPTKLWPDPGPTVQTYIAAGRWRPGDGCYYARPGAGLTSLP